MLGRSEIQVFTSGLGCDTTVGRAENEFEGVEKKVTRMNVPEKIWVAVS